MIMPTIKEQVGKDKWGATTEPVGSFKPNGYGLYDVAGNVGEWCQNQIRHPTEQGYLSGIASGSWFDGMSEHGSNTIPHLDADFGHYRHPNSRLAGTGFRCVVDLP